MSTFSQNPDPITTFAELAAETVVAPTWQIVFDAAEEHLAATRPSEFDTEDIGRTAWSWLKEPERESALDVLFYTYWSAQVNDAEELARFERERAPRAALRERLAEFRSLADRSRPVPYALLADIATLAEQLMGGAS
ncbi:hypothetical protein [Streptomyces sp. NPDC059994]|uniref:hypothetical protein n=1 Tax=Streptomyces sp. NPDC059994 TaxID=3347029 RepID=UPI0036B3C7F7